MRAGLQVYAVQDSTLCLTGTAEVPLGAMYMDQTLTEDQLPLKLAGFGHCFRTEAGAAGTPALCVWAGGCAMPHHAKAGCQLDIVHASLSQDDSPHPSLQRWLYSRNAVCLHLKLARVVWRSCDRWTVPLKLA